MLIYSPDITPRLKYTFDLVFRGLLGLDYRLTDIREEIINHKNPRLNYSPEKIEGIPFIQACSLLFEDSIKPQDDKTAGRLSWDGLPAFFPAAGDSIIPFDIFAATFFVVSRYEEYLPYEADSHQRFHSGLSLAHRMGFLEEPLVDQWIMKLGRLIERTFPGKIKISPQEFSFKPTIDIDNAWAFRHKGLWRTAGAVLRPGQTMELRNFRYQVLRGKQHDPYDQYRKIENLHSEFGIDPEYFFLVGRYGKFDTNISSSNKAFRKLVAGISERHETGLHPSYGSCNHPEMILREKSILEAITGSDVTSSRQHYLRLRLPLTYQALLKAGISNDYTMGYADSPGFRAGIARPFYFFDLFNNKATHLRVFPFQVMDTGLRDYQGCSPEQAKAKISGLIKKTREAGGTFISLWHNEAFSEWAGWEGWTSVYQAMLAEAAK